MPADQTVIIEGKPEDWGTRIAPRATTAPVVSDSELDDEPDTPLERIARMLSTVSADDKACVKVYRVKDGNGHKLEWVKDYTTQDFEIGGLEMIRSQWGGGDYQIRLYGVRNGRAGIIAREDIGIVADPKATAAPVMQQNSELAGVMRQMLENQQAMMLALQQRPQPDPNQQMQQTLALIASVKDIFAAPAPAQQGSPKSQLGEIVSAIRELREVSNEINPPAAPAEDSMIGMIGPVLELVKAGMNRPSPVLQPVELPQTLAFPPVVAPIPAAVQTAPAPIPAAPEVVAASPITDNEATAAGITPEQAQMALADIRKHLAAALALAGTAPVIIDGESVNAEERAAEIIYENMPDEVIEALDMPQWFDLLCQFEPACKPHETFIRAAHAIVLEMLDQDEQEATPEASAATAPGLPTP